MTVKQIAELEQVSIQTVRQWIKLKKLKAKQFVDGYFIDDKDYQKYSKERRLKNEYK